MFLGDPSTTQFIGRTDAFGGITFSDPSLVGPVDMTVAAAKFQPDSLLAFDATDVTIFINPLPDPNAMPGGVGLRGRLGGSIGGAIVFGNALAIGSSSWDLVPDPRVPTAENKRCYIYPTGGDVFSGRFNAALAQVVDYVPNQTSWPFNLAVRSSALAIAGVCGLYDSGSTAFEPFALGVARAARRAGAGTHPHRSQHRHPARRDDRGRPRRAAAARHARLDRPVGVHDRRRHRSRR